MVFDLRDTLTIFGESPGLMRPVHAEDEPLVIPYVEIAVSMQCTLSCRDCCLMVPHYQAPAGMDAGAVLAAAEAFLEAVDRVIEFRIMGGEALLQKELPQVLETLLSQPKIEHLELVSNATLLPRPPLLEVLCHAKASIFFSNYGPRLCPHYRRIVDTCLDAGIMVRASGPERTWVDYGPPVQHTTSLAEMQTIYSSCDMICKHIWNGELHVCPRSAHGRALGFIPVPPGDYVPLLTTPPDERRRRIRELYELDCITACGYCLYTNGTPVPAAIQTTT